MQKEISNELADRRLNEINKLDKKVNLDDLIYKYKGNTPNEEFYKYDNALDLIDKITNGEIKLAEVKNNQNNFTLNLGEKKRGRKSKEQKKRNIQYWNALQSKERGHWFFWWLFFNGIWSKK